jgi:pyruvate dehydrogenase E1 component alpha subunit
MKTYRFVGHSRSDQAAYRPEGEAEMWPDPIEVFGARLRAEGALDDAGARAVAERVAGRVERALAFAEASPEPELSAIFANVHPSEGGR